MTINLIVNSAKSAQSSLFRIDSAVGAFIPRKVLLCATAALFTLNWSRMQSSKSWATPAFLSLTAPCAYISPTIGFVAQAISFILPIKRSSPHNTVILENNPVILENNPVILENNPVILENNPVILENNPVILENNPVILENNPVILRNNTVILKPSNEGDLIQQLRAIPENRRPQIKTLKIQNSPITKISCDQLAQLLPNLSRLELSELRSLNQLLDLSNLTQLSQLELSYLDVFNHPLDLSNLTQLSQLILHDLPVFNQPLDLSNLTQLSQLKLGSLHSFNQPLDFSNLTQLSQLKLSHLLVFNHPLNFSNLTQLSQLELLYLPVFNHPLDLSNLTQLSQLELWELPVFNHLLDLSKLTQLSQLELLYLPVFNHLLDLSKLTQLTELKLLYLPVFNHPLIGLNTALIQQVNISCPQLPYYPCGLERFPLTNLQPLSDTYSTVIPRIPRSLLNLAARAVLTHCKPEEIDEVAKNSGQLTDTLDSYRRNSCNIPGHAHAPAPPTTLEGYHYIRIVGNKRFGGPSCLEKATHYFTPLIEEQPIEAAVNA